MTLRGVDLAEGLEGKVGSMSESLYLRKGMTEGWEMVTVEGEWLTPNKAAKKVGVTSSTVYRWIRKGQLVHYVTPGGTIRIKIEDIVTRVVVEEVEP